MATFIWNINSFKFCVADDRQVKADFSRNYQHIFINGKSLKKIYEAMGVIDQGGFIKKDYLLTTLWNKYCFEGAHTGQLPHWEKFANALLHQGGLLYGFESILKEKMSLPENNNKAYFPQNTEKEVHIHFDKNKQCLIIQEKCRFTKIQDLHENNLVAKGNYLIKAQLSHYISLSQENSNLIFRHIIEQPEFECGNSELQESLNQRRLSIMEAFKNFISKIISKIFQLEFEPNRPSFFQKPCYESYINQSQIDLKDGSSNLLENCYTKITN